MYSLQYKHTKRSFRYGFSIIELLVVIAVIIILISLLIVALAAASNMAAAARTTSTMNAMQQGFAQFESDFGQLPPVLGTDNPNDISDYRAQMRIPNQGDFTALQDWYSLTSPTEYLLGYGQKEQDGNDGLGFRDPGYDYIWNASADADNNGTPGEISDRRPKFTGEIHGPYMQLDDASLLGAIVGFNNGQPTIALPTDANYDSAAPKVILDYWGKPIRYYLRHPVSQIHARNNQNISTMTLGDVFLLRPFSISDDEDATGAADNAGDDGTTLYLKAASFALFSSGPDRTGNQNYRFDDPDLQGDTSYANQDNIVEVGK